MMEEIKTLVGYRVKRWIEGNPSTGLYAKARCSLFKYGHDGIPVLLDRKEFIAESSENLDNFTNKWKESIESRIDTIIKDI